MRIVVVEDEQVVADRLLRLIRDALGTRLETLTHVATLPAAYEHLRTRPADVVFLDLNLNGRDGFRLLERAVAGSFQTIVVSAHHDQAVRAFEYGVTDFVPKPFDAARLAVAIERVTLRDESIRQHLRALAVRNGNEIVLVPLEQVLYVKGAGDYSEVHLSSGDSHLHDKSLTALEHLLPTRFERVHRSYIVDTAAIESFRGEPGSRYFLRLSTGVEVPVGRTRFKELKRRLV